ncbi:hypothetical protein BGZ96_011230 [Linnemannia gamsii]|uniref:Uncharacterized protein n=1 Tax=Linnemannia gamsii TaxID=64522 RepID=A0ABQ7JSL6_9FUNG|nr:hypothetical protein BGZ96_011230 [Linnemannia gamsii]
MGSALNNHFVGDSPTLGGTSDGTWISTYSRGLCSMYHNDEDHCWEAILHAQSSTAFNNSAQHQQPALQGNNRRHGPHAHHHNHLHGQQQQYTQTVTAMGMESTSRDDNNNYDPALEEADVGARLVPTSPGSGLSQAFCNFGFNCIDFVTGDDLGSEPVIANSYFASLSHSHSPHTSTEDGLEADSTILEDKKGSSSWARRVWRAL